MKNLKEILTEARTSGLVFDAYDQKVKFCFVHSWQTEFHGDCNIEVYMVNSINELHLEDMYSGDIKQFKKDLESMSSLDWVESPNQNSGDDGWIRIF